MVRLASAVARARLVSAIAHRHWADFAISLLHGEWQRWLGVLGARVLLLTQLGQEEEQASATGEIHQFTI